MLVLTVVIFAAVLAGGYIFTRAHERNLDDAYLDGWRDGYDLGHAHGANRIPRQRERYAPHVRRS